MMEWDFPYSIPILQGLGLLSREPLPLSLPSSGPYGPRFLPPSTASSNSLCSFSDLWPSGKGLGGRKCLFFQAVGGHMSAGGAITPRAACRTLQDWRLEQAGLFLTCFPGCVQGPLSSPCRESLSATLGTRLLPQPVPGHSNQQLACLMCHGHRWLGWELGHLPATIPVGLWVPGCRRYLSALGS